jgi:hypothetical protein
MIAIEKRHGRFALTERSEGYGRERATKCRSDEVLPSLDPRARKSIFRALALLASAENRTFPVRGRTVSPWLFTIIN